MGDLISRQALLESIEKISVKGNVLDDDWIYRFVQEFPSAEPEIIRCRDCAKREYCRTSTVWAVAPNGDWYCADAERKEE